MNLTMYKILSQNTLYIIGTLMSLQVPRSHVHSLGIQYTVQDGSGRKEI